MSGVLKRPRSSMGSSVCGIPDKRGVGEDNPLSLATKASSAAQHVASDAYSQRLFSPSTLEAACLDNDQVLMTEFLPISAATQPVGNTAPGHGVGPSAAVPQECVLLGAMQLPPYGPPASQELMYQQQQPDGQAPPLQMPPPDGVPQQQQQQQQPDDQQQELLQIARTMMAATANKQLEAHQEPAMCALIYEMREGIIGDVSETNYPDAVGTSLYKAIKELLQELEGAHGGAPTAAAAAPRVTKDLARLGMPAEELLGPVTLRPSRPLLFYTEGSPGGSISQYRVLETVCSDYARLMHKILKGGPERCPYTDELIRTTASVGPLTAVGGITERWRSRNRHTVWAVATRMYWCGVEKPESAQPTAGSLLYSTSGEHGWREAGPAHRAATEAVTNFLSDLCECHPELLLRVLQRWLQGEVRHVADGRGKKRGHGPFRPLFPPHFSSGKEHRFKLTIDTWDIGGDTRGRFGVPTTSSRQKRCVLEALMLSDVACAVKEDIKTKHVGQPADRVAAAQFFATKVLNFRNPTRRQDASSDGPALGSPNAADVGPMVTVIEAAAGVCLNWKASLPPLAKLAEAAGASVNAAGVLAALVKRSEPLSLQAMELRRTMLGVQRAEAKGLALLLHPALLTALRVLPKGLARMAGVLETLDKLLGNDPTTQVNQQLLEPVLGPVRAPAPPQAQPLIQPRQQDQEPLQDKSCREVFKAAMLAMRAQYQLPEKPPLETMQLCITRLKQLDAAQHLLLMKGTPEAAAVAQERAQALLLLLLQNRQQLEVQPQQQPQPTAPPQASIPQPRDGQVQPPEGAEVVWGPLRAGLAGADVLLERPNVEEPPHDLLLAEANLQQLQPLAQPWAAPPLPPPRGQQPERQLAPGQRPKRHVIEGRHSQQQKRPRQPLLQPQSLPQSGAAAPCCPTAPAAVSGAAAAPLGGAMALKSAAQGATGGPLLGGLRVLTREETRVGGSGTGVVAHTSHLSAGPQWSALESLTAPMQRATARGLQAATCRGRRLLQVGAGGVPRTPGSMNSPPISTPTLAADALAAAAVGGLPLVCWAAGSAPAVAAGIWQTQGGPTAACLASSPQTALAQHSTHSALLNGSGAGGIGVGGGNGGGWDQPLGQQHVQPALLWPPYSQPGSFTHPDALDQRVMLPAAAAAPLDFDWDAGQRQMQLPSTLPPSQQQPLQPTNPAAPPALAQPLVPAATLAARAELACAPAPRTQPMAVGVVPSVPQPHAEMLEGVSGGEVDADREFGNWLSAFLNEAQKPHRLGAGGTGGAGIDGGDSGPTAATTAAPHTYEGGAACPGGWAGGYGPDPGSGAPFPDPDMLSGLGGFGLNDPLDGDPGLSTALADMGVSDHDGRLNHWLRSEDPRPFHLATAAAATSALGIGHGGAAGLEGQAVEPPPDPSNLQPPDLATLMAMPFDGCDWEYTLND